MRSGPASFSATLSAALSIKLGLKRSPLTFWPSPSVLALPMFLLQVSTAAVLQFWQARLPQALQKCGHLSISGSSADSAIVTCPSEAVSPQFEAYYMSWPHLRSVLSALLSAIQWLGFCGCFTGVLSPMLPALTLVLTTIKQPDPPFAVARFFSLPLFKWLADITYDIYLVHPLVRR